MPLAGHRMIPREAYRYAYKAGWVGAQPGIIVVSVGMAESDLFVGAYNDQNQDGSIDRSWLQINSKHTHMSDGTSIDSARLLNDPLYAAIVGFDIYKRAGFKFTPWASYTSGRYKEFLEKAITGQANYWREYYSLPLGS